MKDMMAMTREATHKLFGLQVSETDETALPNQLWATQLKGLESTQGLRGSDLLGELGIEEEEELIVLGGQVAVTQLQELRHAQAGYMAAFL
jgi:hypothetical protein